MTVDNAALASRPDTEASAEVTLAELLGLVAGPAGAACEYMVGGVTASPDELESAAQMIADDAIRIRCGESPVLAWWRARRDGGPPLAEQERSAVAVFIEPTFGLPGDEPEDEGVGGEDSAQESEEEDPKDHLQGFVAELLWNRLIIERTVCADGRRLLHTEEVKGDPTGTGGDGLVVYEIQDGTLVFRLWEIKKHTSSKHVSSTVKRAATQLSDHGARYLAMMTAPGTKHPGELGRLFGQLVQLWLEESPRAGVGVSIATSAHHAPKRHPAFKGVAEAFPRFSAAGQREALMVAVADFPAFADRVQEIVWTGL